MAKKKRVTQGNIFFDDNDDLVRVGGDRFADSILNGDAQRIYAKLTGDSSNDSVLSASYDTKNIKNTKINYFPKWNTLTATQKIKIMRTLLDTFDTNRRMRSL